MIKSELYIGRCIIQLLKWKQIRVNFANHQDQPKMRQTLCGVPKKYLVILSDVWRRQKDRWGEKKRMRKKKKCYHAAVTVFKYPFKKNIIFSPTTFQGTGDLMFFVP